MFSKKISGIITALALSLVLSMSLTGCRKDIEAFGVKVKLERRTLSNGLTVFMVEDHTVPVVSYQTWFRVGSVDESPGITGVSHLFEHLMFKGTPKYGPKQFFEQLEAKGAEVNAYTTRDYTVYYENFTPDLLERVIDMESDRLANLKLDEAVLETEKQVVLEERRLRTDNSTGGRMQEALWEQAFQYHPYRWPVIGAMEDVAGIPLAEVVAYFKRHYQPSNATLVIVGDIDPERTFALIKKAYSGIPSGPMPKRNPVKEPEQNEERSLVIRDHLASESFSQAYHITSAHEADTHAIDVLSNILFEGNSSRAYRKLVDEKDLMTGISGSSYTPSYPGLLIVSGSLKGKVTYDEVTPVLDQVIREVQEKGVTKEEIDTAVRQLTVQLVDSVRTPHGLGQLIGTVHLILGDAGKFSEDLSKYLKVTAADVKRVAQKYLVPNNRTVVRMMPEKGPRS